MLPVLASQGLFNSSWFLCAVGTACTDLWEQQTASCWPEQVRFQKRHVASPLSLVTATEWSHVVLP